MHRFEFHKNHRSYRFAFVSLLFALLLLLFLYGVDTLSDSNLERQKDALEKALTQSITYCYSVEGIYPEDLNYLKEHYGLTYNEELFFVDYRTTGANLLPDVTIIERKD